MASIGAEDLMRAQSLDLDGKRQHVRLDPAICPSPSGGIGNPGRRRYGPLRQ